jgi:hypothetical protein
MLVQETVELEDVLIIQQMQQPMVGDDSKDSAPSPPPQDSAPSPPPQDSAHITNPKTFCTTSTNEKNQGQCCSRSGRKEEDICLNTPINKAIASNCCRS